MFRDMHTSQNLTGASQVSPADAQLRKRIEDQMHVHGEVDASKIGVVVRNGEVLLWGSVASEHERSLAGEVAAKVTGRTSIINHIQVYRTTQS
jgi:osmotically-inducible protein OsmY